ncbi:hypothetical protein D3C81_1876790 [compost metagenome]
MGELAQSDGCRDIGHVELAAQYIHVQSIEAVAGHALQAILLRQSHFIRVVQHQATALRAGDVLVGLEAERHKVARGANALAAPA